MTDEHVLEVDDELADDALTVLADHECEHGGGALNPRTGQCGDDDHSHCAWFCGTAWCDHQFISWNDGIYDGPDVPEPPLWLGPVPDWPDAWKREVFGDDRQLAEYYGEVEGGRLRTMAAYDIAVHLCGEISIATSAGHILRYAESPGLAWSELETLLSELQGRFERLAIDRCGVSGLRDEVAAVLTDLECPRCDSPIEGSRP